MSNYPVPSGGKKLPIPGNPLVKAAVLMKRNGPEFKRRIKDIYKETDDKALMAKIKENPITFFLAAKETSDLMGLTDLFDSIMGTDANTYLTDTDAVANELLEASRTHSGGNASSQDAVIEPAETVAKYRALRHALADDFAMVERAAGAIGGINRLIDIRAALELPLETLIAFRNERKAG